MYEFMNGPRTYPEARKAYKFECPENFNFAFDVIDRRGREADKTAVIAVDKSGEHIQKLSYSDLSRRSARFANGLRELGLKQGDFALLIAGRIPEWYDALFGCMKLGVVAIPGTNLLTTHDIEYRVNSVKARAIIVTPEHCEKVESMRAECPTLEHLIVIGGPREGWISTQELCTGRSDEIAPEHKPNTRSDDMMMGFFTSGTTGMPKMVPRAFEYGLAHASTALFWMDLQPDDVHWTLTDTGWAKAAWGMLFPQFLMGVTVVLYDPDGFDVDQHLKLIGKLGVTTFCGPPTAYRLFAQTDVSAYDFTSLRRSMGAGEPLNPEVIHFWKKATGTTVADGYGQSETVNIVANFPDQPVKIGSMGQPVPGFDVDVVDEEGNRMPVDEIGNIAVCLENGTPPGLFTGYFTGGEPNKKDFRNGWYFTGDTARRDADGYLWFIGRADDLIGSGGYRISPFEVESTLLEHPLIAESAVIGKPDATRGQIVSAYIILIKGQEPSEALAKEIQDFCKKYTAPYKYPREINFVTELPKTISGKIRRVELRATQKAE